MRRFSISAVLTGLAAALTVNAGIAAVSAGAADRPGDVDENCAVSVADSVLLARYCSEDPEARVTVQGVRNADCNRDGLVTSEDNGVLIGYLAGVNNDLDLPQQAEGTTAPSANEQTEFPETDQTDVPETEQTTAIETEQTFDSSFELTGTETETTVQDSETTASGTTAGSSVLPTDASALIVGERVLPLGHAAANVLGFSEIKDIYGDVTEILTLAYNSCTMDFYVFASDPADTLIMFSRDGIVVGYYTTGKEYVCTNLYTITEYRDTHPDGTGEMYAVMALHSSAYLVVDSVADPSDLSVFAKLNYYVTNAIRGINGRNPLRWNPLLAECAAAHSLALASVLDGAIGQPHLDPVTGSTPTDRIIAAVGTPCKPLGENVDKGFRHPFSSAHKWYISTGGHRETMLNDKYTDLGVGYGYLPQTNIFGTQDYATLAG